MATLRSKSAEEISWMLDDYGIKHGPVVDSTRSLYEKKLREAMAKDKRAKPSSDKTYYREEPEVTYVQYHTPMRHEDSGDRGKSYLRSERSNYRDLDFTDEPDVYRTQASYVSPSRHTPLQSESSADSSKQTGSARLIPLWVQLLVFLLVAGVLFFIFINMESDQGSPLKKLT